jgi:hypothetical protein
MMFEFASNVFLKMIKRAVRIYVHLRNMYRINIRSALFMIHPLGHGLANSRAYVKSVKASKMSAAPSVPRGSDPFGADVYCL